ncbi:MAG: ribonuclease III [Clostridia bacterium]|nr:ribonuclease III [Clostridia bacterium]MBO5315923.1 ribonuclease III [Clostridia bacterium]
MAIGKEIVELQKKLGYTFRDISYLELALTHTSYTNEQRSRGINVSSNERLEFLGDAVLELCVSEYLYSEFKKHREGALTKMRQNLVCEKTLAKIAAELNLGDYINVGHGEELTDCRKRPKLLADAMEAIIGAVYLDCGRAGDTWREVIISLYKDEFNLIGSVQNTDCKTRLQQLVEQDGSSVLEYRIIKTTGPEHKKSFTVAAFINNNEVGRGEAGSKKDAEMQAAAAALSLFGVNI